MQLNNEIKFLNKYNGEYASSNFYSEKMFISKKFLNQNHLKLTYQRQFITNLDAKHKDWSKNLDY